MRRLQGTRLFAATAVAVFVADQLTKWLVLRLIPENEQWPAATTLLGRYFSFTHVGNTGVAFGMFQGKSDLFLVLALAVIAALLAFRHRLPRQSRLLQLAIGMQVGGATGNLVDRARLGHVIDFVDVKVWPVFNVADPAIVGGVLLLAWYLWREDRERATEEPRD